MTVHCLPGRRVPGCRARLGTGGWPARRTAAARSCPSAWRAGVPARRPAPQVRRWRRAAHRSSPPARRRSPPAQQQDRGAVTASGTSSRHARLPTGPSVPYPTRRRAVKRHKARQRPPSGIDPCPGADPTCSLNVQTRLRWRWFAVMLVSATGTRWRVQEAAGCGGAAGAGGGPGLRSWWRWAR